jgi:hypothetical protein
MKKKAKKKGGKARARKRGGAGRRPANESLEAYMKSAMKGRGKMGIASIASAVKRSGYATASRNLMKIVGMRLGNRRVFKRIARGVYSLK